MKVKIYHNGDDVFVAWKPDGFIPDCREFALMRRRNGIEEKVSTWVGFTGQEHKEGERRASTNWPIQKYQWTDYIANPGDKVQYRVLPMVGRDKDNLHPDSGAASDWTEEITLIHELAPKIEAYFNRGIVAARWVSRRLDVTDSQSALTCLFGFRSRFERIGLLVAHFLSCLGRDKMKRWTLYSWFSRVKGCL